MLAHWKYIPRVDLSLHSDTLSWFRANQVLLVLLYAVCLAEKQQIPILKSGSTRLGLEPTIYCTRGEHANYDATDCIVFEELAASNSNLYSVKYIFTWWRVAKPVKPIFVIDKSHIDVVCSLNSKTVFSILIQGKNISTEKA